MYYSISFNFDGVPKLTRKLAQEEKNMMLEALLVVAINDYHRVSNVTIHKTL